MNLSIEAASRICEQIVTEVERAVTGLRDPITLVLTAILADTHVLIEDLPGVGKTLLARSMAAVLGCEFTRVQHTPDLLPSDLTGVNVYQQDTGQLTFHPGPVFTNILLADEVNRTPPKTQSALLEAMAEHQVSVDGITRHLPVPFVVLATENPIEYEGTYPLPEAQLDRFGMRIRLGYLGEADEFDLVTRRLAAGFEVPSLRPITDPVTIVALRDSANAVQVDPDVVDYGLRLVRASREHPQLEVGASTRATLTLLAAARAVALQHGRDYVVPDDIHDLAVPVLAHRLVIRPELWARQVTGDTVVGELLDRVEPPPARTRRDQ